MAATARKVTPSPKQATRLKTFHATVLVTRAEEWFVEAETAEEAQALLAAGYGHRVGVGERVHLEVERVLGDSDD
jgi:hypothetical protein